MFGFDHQTPAPPGAQLPPLPESLGLAPAPAGGQKANRMSIVLFSGTTDKLLAASILATGAAAMGMEVDLFLTTWGIVAFRKDDYKTNTRVSRDYEDYGPVMAERMHAKHAPTWMENLLGAREIGDVKIAACSMTMELFGLTLTDLEPIVDEITGVASFVERARESQISLFI